MIIIEQKIKTHPHAIFELLTNDDFFPEEVKVHVRSFKELQHAIDDSKAVGITVVIFDGLKYTHEDLEHGFAGLDKTNAHEKLMVFLFAEPKRTLATDERIDNLVGILDGYFAQGAHHLNVNVLDRDTLIEAMNFPERHPMTTIRVSGYAVHFNRLTREQQEEVISRTFHGEF